MNFDFDEQLDRTASHCTKYEKYAGRDILPLWVADMDFASAPAIIAALQQRVAHGVFGYTLPPPALDGLIVERLQRRYQWQVSADDILYLPGVVQGLNMACRGLVSADQAVMTATPVYYPFLDAPGYQHRQLIEIPVDKQADGFHYPVDQFEEQARANPGGLLLLCNPYNPVGRALNRDELASIADICEQHDILICSDEVHCDLLFDDRQHLPIASLSSAAAARTVTLMAPSKTFNIAGLGGSFAVVQDPALRARFKAAGAGFLPGVNLLAYEAMLAAYRDGGPWHEALIPYLQGNRDYLSAAIDDMPGIEMHRVEATYLAWLDISALGVKNPAGFFESHGLGLSPGRQFGDGNFMRLNFGCPRATLEEAVKRLQQAVEKA